MTFEEFDTSVKAAAAKAPKLGKSLKLDLGDSRGVVEMSLGVLHAAGYMTNISVQDDFEYFVLPVIHETSPSSDGGEGMT